MIILGIVFASFFIWLLVRLLSTPTLDPPIKESVKLPNFKHERVTGTLRGDLEAAVYALENAKDEWRASLFSTSGIPLQYSWQKPPLSKAARNFNLWEDTLLAYIAYQNEKRWKEDFVKREAA